MTKVAVTGAAGFIGSHLVEELLRQGHYVIAVDNLWTGHTANLHEAINRAGDHAKARIEFYEQDIRDFSNYGDCDVLYHLAALGSVPRSIEKPLQTHQSNAEGFFLALNRARKQRVRRIVYASSSSVYGDSTTAPQQESYIGKPLSPYAASKRINEVYSESFTKAYGLECVGLRFFNVYGPRQYANSPYSPVIPKWISAMKANADIEIYGDGSNERDFTYVKDVVQGLIKASNAPKEMIDLNSIYNIGTQKSTSLNQLFLILKELTGYKKNPIYLPQRHGDRKNSLADISVSAYGLDYKPNYDLIKGLSETILYDHNYIGTD